MPFVISSVNVHCTHLKSCWLFAGFADHLFGEIVLVSTFSVKNWRQRVTFFLAELLFVSSQETSSICERVSTVLIFIVRRYALHGLSYRNSVRLSVTLVHCVHIVRPTIMISSPYGSPIILVSGYITIISKFEGGHPERGRWMRVGWARIGDFQPISRRISEMVRDTTKVTINHY